MKKIYKWLEDGIAIVGFFIIIGIFFSPTILQGKLPVPSDALVGLYHPFRDLYAETNPRGVPFKNFLITDPVRQQIPWRKIVIDAWKNGVRPRLNPYTFTGVPLDANIQAAPYYPLNILFLIFDFPIAWTLLIILQPILAGVFLYLFLRHHNISIFASFIGVLSWAFGGFATAWLTWGTIMHTALWLPLTLLSIDKLSVWMSFPRKRESIFRFSKTGSPIRSGMTHTRLLLWPMVFIATLIFQFLAGHAQISLYFIFVVIAYGTMRILQAKERRKAMLVFIFLFSLVALFTVVQWVPFLRFLSESGRVGALDSWKTAGWFLPWQHLIQFIAPDFFGNPATLNYWGIWNYGEFIGYIGVIPLLFAISTFGLTGVPRFFVGIVSLSFFFMLPHPLSRLPFQLHIPIISVLQPTRLMVIVDFSLAILAAFGFDLFLRGNKKQVRKSSVKIGLVLLVLWLVTLSAKLFINNSVLLANLTVAKRNLVIPSVLFAGFLLMLGVFQTFRHRKLQYIGLGILIVVVLFDLFRFGWKFTPFTPMEYFFPTTNVIRFLQNQPKPFRVMSLDDRILPSNVSAYYGIESIDGYDPIAPRLYEDFLVASERGKADISKPTGFNRIYIAHNIDSPLLPYFNVRYVLSLVDVDRPFLREIMTEGETRVYEYILGLPRVYIADKVVISQAQGNTLSTLVEDKTLRLGVYDGQVDIKNIRLSEEETTEIIKYRPHDIQIKVNVTDQRLLIVLNRYDARWTARIDNQGPTQIFLVNYLFMGLVVPPGTHDVILSYH